MNYKWIYEAPSPADAAAATELAKEVGIHPALGKLLFDRDIRTLQEARHFFRPQLTELPRSVPHERHAEGCRPG